MGVVTITRPNFDAATYVGSLALKHAIYYMRSRGLIVDDLEGDRARRQPVLDSLSRNDSVFFCGVGHGNEQTFTGQWKERIWWVCDCKELKDRVIYLLSCLTGQGLGSDMVNNKGARAYIGYKVEFTWIQAQVQDPLLDPYGRAFFEPVLEIYKNLADGKTVGEAYLASMDKWNYWIDYWSKSDDPVAPSIVQLLLWDRNGQVLYGDENSVIVQPFQIPVPWLFIAGTFSTVPMIVIGGVVLANEFTKHAVPTGPPHRHI
jgi:hypothetical protein